VFRRKGFSPADIGQILERSPQRALTIV
jgi:hypothetical protein